MAQHTDDPAIPPTADQSATDLPLIELETLLDRPPSRRKRLAQIVFMLAAAVIALALFWSANTPGAQTPSSAAPAPAPPPTLLILSNINYGTVTVNGKKQPGQLPMLVPVQGDTYTIMIDAPPFLPKTCHVQLSHPEPPGDNTCFSYPLSSSNWTVVNGVTVAPAYELDVSFMLNDLPPAQQSSVTTTLTRVLTYQQAMTVPAGSYFVTGVDAAGKISSQRATAPLQADAIVAPFIPQNDQYYAPCVAFICQDGIETQTARSSADYFWDITVIIAVRWRFNSASGAAISDVQFQETSGVTLRLSYGGAEDWSVPSLAPPQAPPQESISDQLTSAFCETGMDLLGQLTGASTSSATGTSYDRGARGCELLLDVAGVDQGFYLWRFGVLLTIDAKARRAHPELPAAPPDEVAAVQQP